MEAEQTISEYELERGKPMPSINHSVVQTALIISFHKCSKQLTFSSELSLELGDFKATPDISVYPKLKIDWLHDKAKKTEPPLLVVEIMSISQGLQEMIEKIEKYFAHGVKSCWLVMPSIQSIAVFTPDMRHKIYSSGTFKDPVTGIEVSIEEIFSLDD